MLRWVLGWAALFGLYLLLAGDAGLEELGAAACCTSVALGAGVLAHRAGGPRTFRFRPGWVRRAIVPAGALVVDLWRVGRVLARAIAGRHPVGVLSRQPFDTGTAAPLDAGRRALVVLGASFAPNGIAVAVAPGALLLHRLDPRPPSPDRGWPL